MELPFIKLFAIFNLNVLNETWENYFKRIFSSLKNVDFWVVCADEEAKKA